MKVIIQLQVNNINYEFTLKTDLKDESEPQEEEKDARCKRSKKTLDSITVSHEK